MVALFFIFFVPGYNDELGFVRTAGGVLRERKGDFGGGSPASKWVSDL